MSKKLTYEFVKAQFEKENYILVSTEYIEAHNKLDYICPKGHQHSIKWNHWQQRGRCPYCYGNIKPTFYKIKESFENYGYILLSKEYVNNHTKLNYRCPKGHEHSIGWNDWRGSHKCPTCAYTTNSLNQMGSKNHQWNGGASYEPYCPIWSDKEYKEDIKLRDGNKCLNPTCNKKDNRLHIHHIDYNKKNCCPSNLITLCGSCNVKANTNREWHTAWYKALLFRRYNYR
jgi:hypothetical protein